LRPEEIPYQTDPTGTRMTSIAFIPKAGANDVFELQSGNGKIILQGNNGISILLLFILVTP
jgi:hypothetical protein